MKLGGKNAVTSQCQRKEAGHPGKWTIDQTPIFEIIKTLNTNKTI
jgi:hypothetical protein